MLDIINIVIAFKVNKIKALMNPMTIYFQFQRLTFFLLQYQLVPILEPVFKVRYTLYFNLTFYTVCIHDFAYIKHIRQVIITCYSSIRTTTSSSITIADSSIILSQCEPSLTSTRASTSFSVISLPFSRMSSCSILKSTSLIFCFPVEIAGTAPALTCFVCSPVSAVQTLIVDTLVQAAFYDH